MFRSKVAPLSDLCNNMTQYVASRSESTLDCIIMLLLQKSLTPQDEEDDANFLGSGGWRRVQDFETKVGINSAADAFLLQQARRLEIEEVIKKLKVHMFGGQGGRRILEKVDVVPLQGCTAYPVISINPITQEGI